MPQVGDVVGYFTKYPGRFISMHLQGVDPKAANPGAQLAVGKDGVDWAKVFAAARTGACRTTSSSRAGTSPSRAWRTSRP
jgi:sugar phosphate isomerase/epimerase